MRYLLLVGIILTLIGCNSSKAGRDITNSPQVIAGGDANIAFEQYTQAPSYRDATIVKGVENAAIPVAGKEAENNLNTAMDILGRMLKGEEVEPHEAYERMFSSQIFINSGTEVKVLTESSKGIGGVVKVRILEGAHKGKEGWVSVSLIKTERRLVSKK